MMYILRRVAESTLIIQPANLLLFFSVCPISIRNQSALLCLFHRYVSHGTTIITDKWRGNITLGTMAIFSRRCEPLDKLDPFSGAHILTGLQGPGPSRKESVEARRAKNSWKFGSIPMSTVNEVLRTVGVRREKICGEHLNCSRWGLVCRLHVQAWWARLWVDLIPCFISR